MSSEPMVYVPTSHQNQLLVTLKSLQENGRSPKALLEELEEWPEFRNNKSKRKTISRQTLERFVRTGICGKTDALAALYDFLRHHHEYRHYLGQAVGKAFDPDVFGAAFAGFLRDENFTNTFLPEAIRVAFPGRYVMYRPDWAPGKQEKGYYRVSQLDLVETGAGVQVTETQDFPDEVPAWQLDTGPLAACGKYAYFLMRQDKGDCVKLGVIREAVPFIGEKLPMQWFQGVIFGASYIGIFPSVKFFCRRVRPGDTPRVGIMKLDGLNDSEALAYLSPPAAVKLAAPKRTPSKRK